MPGQRNPISMTSLVNHLHGAVDKAKSNMHDLTTVAKSFADDKHLDMRYADLTIQFIGASGLPKMDVVGKGDPYFVAKIDKKISFVSTVKADTVSPVWNEIWRVNNVPTTATLSVEVMDKDDGTLTDGYIGKFDTSVTPGAKETEIEGPLLRRSRGSFWLKIESTPSTDPKDHPYLFDGPVRFSKHYSPTVGILTNLNDARLYATWKMYIRGVPLVFGDTVQPWNRNYKAAQSIFQGPTSVAVRSGIQAGHRLLYARSSTNIFGIVKDSEDIFSLLRGGNTLSNTTTTTTKSDCSLTSTTTTNTFANRVKPAVYTYIISADDHSFRFSETGAAFFVDFASKHALHSNCAPAVVYSGEFHPRPAIPGGWDAFEDKVADEDVEWELVIDNNSGTYSPDAMLLPNLKKLLEYNFPGFHIQALAHENPELKKSTDACRAYALKHRGVHKEELEPHAGDGEVTLCAAVASNALGKKDETKLAAEPPKS